MSNKDDAIYYLRLVITQMSKEGNYSSVAMIESAIKKLNELEEIRSSIHDNLIKAIGMQEENMHRRWYGNAQTYKEEDFLKLLSKKSESKPILIDQSPTREFNIDYKFIKSIIDRLIKLEELHGIK